MANSWLTFTMPHCRSQSTMKITAKLVAHGGLDLLGMEAHGAVADDAVHLALGAGHLGAQGLGDAGAQHAELEGGEQAVGRAHLVIEVGPDGRVATVDDQNGVVVEELLANGGDVGLECRGDPPALAGLVELGARCEPRLPVCWRAALRVRPVPSARSRLLELDREGGEEALGVGEHRDVERAC